MSGLPVTVAIVPRETFSDSIASLESFYANTPMPCEMIYVDGNSPEPVCSAIKGWQSDKQFKLIRSEQYLAPNQARNLAVQHVKTKYVVFYDNNVVVTPGWLERLVECAEETGAWVVSPLYLEGDLAEGIIHTAGGVSHFGCVNGRRGFIEEHRFHDRKIDEVRPCLRREPTELVEFHCVLVRTELFELTGPLDEKLMSMADHIDLSLSARELGKPVYTEPAAVVTYRRPMLSSFDVPYFRLRWSDEWTEATIEHLQQKWNLPQDDLFLMSQFGFVRHHRQAVFSASGLEQPEWQSPGEGSPCSALMSPEPKVDSKQAEYLRQKEPPIETTASAAGEGPAGDGDLSRCSQTVVQLFNQLYEAGYSKDQLSLVGASYQLVMRLFTGQFRASGKTFIAHLIGTASLLAKLSTAPQIVITGLLHSVYEYGNFFFESDVEKRRTLVREIVGESIETLIWAYNAFKWQDGTIEDTYSRFNRLSQLERDVFLIRLVNELEEFIDGSIGYCGNIKYEFCCGVMTRQNVKLVEMANALGFPQLASAIASVPQMIPNMPRRLFAQLDVDRSFFVAPSSHEKEIG